MQSAQQSKLPIINRNIKTRENASFFAKPLVNRGADPGSKHILPQNNIFCNIKSRVLPKKLDRKDRIYYNKYTQHKNKPIFCTKQPPNCL